jgi:hypothetical protein
MPNKSQQKVEIILSKAEMMDDQERNYEKDSKILMQFLFEKIFSITLKCYQYLNKKNGSVYDLESTFSICNKCPSVNEMMQQLIKYEVLEGLRMEEDLQTPKEIMKNIFSMYEVNRKTLRAKQLSIIKYMDILGMTWNLYLYSLRNVPSIFLKLFIMKTVF